MSQKDAIASPYAHAGLTAGDAEFGWFADDTVDIALVFVTFREHVKKTQKPLRGLRLVAFDESGSTSDQLCRPKAFSLERFEHTFIDVFEIWRVWRRRATPTLKRCLDDLAAHT